MTEHLRFSQDQHVIVSGSGGAVSLFRFKSLKYDGKDIAKRFWETGQEHGTAVPSLASTLKGGASGQAANAVIGKMGAGESKVWRSAAAANSESAEALLQGLPYFGGGSTAPAPATPPVTPSPPAPGGQANPPRSPPGK